MTQYGVRVGIDNFNIDQTYIAVDYLHNYNHVKRFAEPVAEYLERARGFQQLTNKEKAKLLLQLSSEADRIED